MPFDRFLIAPQNTGMQTDLRPWLINDDAWQELKNVYAFRGRMRKRFGSLLMSSTPNYSRLSVQVGTIGAPISPVPGHIFAVGQQFQAGTQIFTVVNAAAGPQAMLATGPGTGTFDVTTGNFTIVGTGLPGATPIYWYPNLPVMGITIYNQGPFNNQPSYAFDQEFAYTWDGTRWIRSQTAGQPVFHGTDLNFFWVYNNQGQLVSTQAMFVTNNFVVNPNGPATANDDPMWTYNADNTAQWAPFTPHFRPNGAASATAGPFVVNARIIVPFQGSLLLLNTIENDNVITIPAPLGTNFHYPQRLRFSWTGDPLSPNAFYEPGQRDTSGPADVNTNIAGGGNFLDAPTDEEIISAQFIKNRLIVFFESSTWEIVYQGNSLDPFRWQKINTELGSESTFSSIPHDRYVLTMGSTGVHSCNGQNVERIDQLIPNQVFDFRQENTSTSRIWGIRDFFVECDYWTYPSSDLGSDQVFPDKILLYNYKTGSWSVLDDCITAFGYFEQQPGATWASINYPWEESDETWEVEQTIAQQRQIIAGNSEGFIFYIKANIDANASNMQITNIQTVGTNTQLKVINHTFSASDFVYIENAQGVTGLNNKIFGQAKVDKDTIDLFVYDAITDSLIPAPFTGVYTGGGIIRRVSNISMLSKQWNPYVEFNRNLFLQKIDFMVEKTTAGEFTVANFASTSFLDMVNQGIATRSGLVTGAVETSPYNPIYYPLEQIQDFVWHPMYFQTDGEFIQILIYWTSKQITQTNIAFAPLEIEALTLYTQPTRNRME